MNKTNEEIINGQLGIKFVLFVEEELDFVLSARLDDDDLVIVALIWVH